MALEFPAVFGSGPTKLGPASVSGHFQGPAGNPDRPTCQPTRPCAAGPPAGTGTAHRTAARPAGRAAGKRASAKGTTLTRLAARVRPAAGWVVAGAPSLRCGLPTG